MNDFTFGAIAGGLIGAAWSKVQAIMSWVTGLLVVRVTIPASELQTAARTWLYTKTKHTRSPFYTFVMILTWVKSARAERPVVFETMDDTTHVFWFGWRPLLVSPSKQESGSGAAGSPASLSSPTAIRLTVFRWTFNIDQWLLTIIEEYRQQQPGSEMHNANRRTWISRYSGRGGARSRVGADNSEAPRPVQSADRHHITNLAAVGRPLGYEIEDLGRPPDEQPFSRLALSPAVLQAIDEANCWLKSESWYTERYIPWRRGWLLHGRPGTGKSSLVRGLSELLGIPIYVYDLATMSNNEFIEYWDAALHSAPCIALIEDIDAVFDGRRNILGDQGGGLTFDCLLNAISGVSAANGIFLIITTNYLDKVDTALSGASEDQPGRPGRVDRVLELCEPDEAGRRMIAQRILSDQQDQVDQLVVLGQGMTGAQFQELCVSRALQHYWSVTVPSKLDYRALDPVVPAARLTSAG